MTITEIRTPPWQWYSSLHMAFLALNWLPVNWTTALVTTQVTLMHWDTADFVLKTATLAFTESMEKNGLIDFVRESRRNCFRKKCPDEATFKHTDGVRRRKLSGHRMQVNPVWMPWRERTRIYTVFMHLVDTIDKTNYILILLRCLYWPYNRL